MHAAGPIHTIEFFPLLSERLLTVLQRLQQEEWARPTACTGWSVKDVTAHLLGGNLSGLWSQSERSPSSDNAVEDFETLVEIINRDNNSWVEAARRISPSMLADLLEITDRRLYEHFQGLHLDEPARISVAWADDQLAPNWFDIAREFTEKWLHQQHIREAVGYPLLVERKWLFPVLDTCMRGVPRAYRSIAAREGEHVWIEVLGEAGGDWSLVRAGTKWELYLGRAPHPDSSVHIDQDLAWRLFTKGLAREAVESRIKIAGDESLGKGVLEVVAIMA